MPVLVTCPKCTFKGNVPDKAIGQKVTCRNCKTPFLVETPSPAPTPASPPAAVPTPAPWPKEIPEPELAPLPNDVELLPAPAPPAPAPPASPTPPADAQELTVCPHCQLENKVAAQVIGTTVICGHCQQPFQAVLQGAPEEPELYETTEAFVSALRLGGALLGSGALLAGAWIGYEQGFLAFCWIVVPTGVALVLLEWACRVLQLLLDLARHVRQLAEQDKEKPAERPARSD